VTVEARHVLVSGRVQGVGFRWSTRLAAESIGVVGWVRNLPDGRVEAWIEGLPGPLGEMLAWFEHVPRPARVDTLESAPRAAEGHVGFRVRR
jgi:acylphosphatase